MIPRLSRSHCTSEPVTATGPRVEQQEVPRPVRVLRFALRQAGLPERRCLLVAEDSRDGHARQRPAFASDAVDLGRAADLGQHRHRNAEIGADLRIPVERLEIHQQSAGRVGDIRHVGALRDVPQNPAVDGAEAEFARVRLLACAVDVVEDPSDLRPREIRGQRQAGALPVPAGPLVAAEFRAQCVGARVLPDDRVVHGFSGVPVPHHRRLALIGDADRGDVAFGEIGFRERGRHHLAGVDPQLHRVVFHPACARKELVVFLLGDTDHRTVVIEDHAAAGGGALVYRGDVLNHTHEATSLGMNPSSSHRSPS
jgi:hypothetical protein